MGAIVPLHSPPTRVRRPLKAGVGSRVWAVISDTVAHHRQKDKQHLCKAHPEKVLVGRVAKIMEFLVIWIEIKVQFISKTFVVIHDLGWNIEENLNPLKDSKNFAICNFFDWHNKPNSGPVKVSSWKFAESRTLSCTCETPKLYPL